MTRCQDVWYSLNMETTQETQTVGNWNVTIEWDERDLADTVQIKASDRVELASEIEAYIRFTEGANEDIQVVRGSDISADMWFAELIWAGEGVATITAALR